MDEASFDIKGIVSFVVWGRKGEAILRGEYSAIGKTNIKIPYGMIAFCRRYFIILLA